MNLAFRKRDTPEFKAQAVERLRRENTRLRQKNEISKDAAIRLGTKLPAGSAK